MSDAADNQREPAASVVCGVCGELIPNGHYWECKNKSEGRGDAWLLRHKKANGKWCKVWAGDAEMLALVAEARPQWWAEVEALIAS